MDSVVVQSLLDRLKRGDSEAKQELLKNTLARLRELTSRILSDRNTLRRFEETDDILQDVLIRLNKRLDAIAISTSTDYFRLAAAIIRRYLIDLIRHYFGPEGVGVHVLPNREQKGVVEVKPSDEPANDTYAPDRLSEWTEFHEYVEQLPEEERTLFDLLWYQELTLREASELLQIPERTLRRKWKAVRLELMRSLGADRQGEESNG